MGMRQLVLEGPRRLALRERPDLRPRERQLRIAVHAAGICGSDLHGYRGENDRRAPGVVMGHEVSGTVDAVGPGVDPAWIGRAVVVNPLLSCRSCPACAADQDNLCPDRALIGCVPRLPGGFADQLVADERSAVPWPGPAPLLVGALVEPLAVGLHATELVALEGRTAVVVGGGLVALGVALAAQRHGAADVTVVVLTPQRRDVIAGFGLTAVVADRPTGPPVDVAFDCVASSASLATAMASTRAAGSVVVVGFGRAHARLPVSALVHGERVLRGSAQYPAQTFVRTAEWVGGGGLDLSAAVGRPQPLARAPELFAELADGESPELRTVLTPDPDRLTP